MTNPEKKIEFSILGSPLGVEQNKQAHGNYDQIASKIRSWGAERGMGCTVVLDESRGRGVRRILVRGQQVGSYIAAAIMRYRMS